MKKPSTHPKANERELIFANSRLKDDSARRGSAASWHRMFAQACPKEITKLLIPGRGHCAPGSNRAQKTKPVRRDLPTCSRRKNPHDGNVPKKVGKTRKKTGRNSPPHAPGRHDCLLSRDEGESNVTSGGGEKAPGQATAQHRKRCTAVNSAKEKQTPNRTKIKKKNEGGPGRRRAPSHRACATKKIPLV